MAETDNRLNDHVIWVQLNKVNVKDYGRWNEWDRLWTEGDKMKPDQWSIDWRNEIKHEQ